MFDGWAQNDISSKSGAPAVVGEPWGYMFDAQGTQHVNYCGQNNHVCELWWNSSGGWHFHDLTAAAEGAQPTASNPRGYVFAAEGTQHVNYLSPNGHVHELYDDSSGWHDNDLTSATGAPNGVGNPRGYMFNAQGTQHVNYRGTDNHIHELWWDKAGWHHNDLTVAANAPDAASDPFGYTFDSRGTMHVNYRGSDNHIHELRWISSGWSHNDLTATVKAPEAAGDPCGYVFAAQSTMHVNYRGTDGHVHELWWDESGWSHNDLTVAAGAPTCTSDPHGYVFIAPSVQNVTYRGSDNHIHLLWWDSVKWNHTDLTVASGAPETGVGSPVPYVFSADGTQHVNYLGNDNQIYELWWPAGYFLPFQVEHQQESEWCFAAVSTSIAHYYDPSSKLTQCQVVNQQPGRSGCCESPGSSTCNKPGNFFLALQFVGHLKSEVQHSGTYGDLSSVLSAGTPPCLRVGWQGGGHHAIAVYGCQSGDMVLVTDPLFGDSLVDISALIDGTYHGNGTWDDTYYTQA